MDEDRINKMAARIASGGTVTIVLDASHEIGYSDSSPVDDDEEGSESVQAALEDAGAEVEWTDEGITLTLPADAEAAVRAVVQSVKDGEHGPAFADYFSKMREVSEGGPEEDFEEE